MWKEWCLFLVCSYPQLPEYNTSHINLYSRYDARHEECVVNVYVSFILSRRHTGVDKTEPISALLGEILLENLVAWVNQWGCPLCYDISRHDHFPCWELWHHTQLFLMTNPHRDRMAKRDTSIHTLGRPCLSDLAMCLGSFPFCSSLDLRLLWVELPRTSRERTRSQLCDLKASRWSSQMNW